MRGGQAGLPHSWTHRLSLPSHPSSTHGPAGTGSAGPAHRSTPAPESGLIVHGGDVGLPVGQLWGRVVSYLHAEVGVWLQSSKLLGSLRVEGMLRNCHHHPSQSPQHPTELHSPAPWQAAAGQGVVGRARRALAASRAPAQPGGRRGLRGSRSAPAPRCAGPAGSVPTIAPRPQHLPRHQERGVTPCAVPSGPPVSQPPRAQPQSEGTMRERAQGGP